MFKKLLRKIQKNPLEKILEKAEKKKSKHFLLFWNRGLGDIDLGLYAMVQRIKEKIPGAKVTFLIREDLSQGFSLLHGVDFIIASNWVRGQRYDQSELLKQRIDPLSYDVIIDWPDPTYWVKWQLGKVIPKLFWKTEYEKPLGSLDIKKGFKYIGR